MDNTIEIGPASGRRAASTSWARKAKTAAARTGMSSTESKLGRKIGGGSPGKAVENYRKILGKP